MRELLLTPTASKIFCNCSTVGSSLGTPSRVTAISLNARYRAPGMCPLEQNSIAGLTHKMTRSGSRRGSASHCVDTSISCRTLGWSLCARTDITDSSTSSAEIMRANIRTSSWLHFFVDLATISAFRTPWRSSRNQRQHLRMAPLVYGTVKHGGVISQIFRNEIHV